MLYISDTDDQRIDIKPDYLKQALDKMKSKNIDNIDYHLHFSSTGYCLVGIINQECSNCIIDLNNYNVNPKQFFNWLKQVLSNYEDYYCIPNKNGEIIWKAFKLKSSDVYLKFSPFKLFQGTLKLRYYKFIFFNMFFTITSSKRLIKLNNKKIFYKINIPDKIELDTF